MTTEDDRKHSLKDRLQYVREALLWKLDGLSERELRLPRTPTGTNLLGLVKHSLTAEASYFGPCFGRPLPFADEVATFEQDEPYDREPNADFVATPDESADDLRDLYRRVQVFADATIDELPLDARGMVPWWPAERNEPTLEQVIGHVTIDRARHAGHADILREQIDGSVGLRPTHSNVPEYDRATYLAKLTAIAEQFD